MEKKGIRCSYAVLVIILFAALAFVTDYTFIQNKMDKCNCPDCSVTGDINVSESNIISTSLKDIAHGNMFGDIVVTKDGYAYFKPFEQYTLANNEDLIKGEYDIDDYILGAEYTKFDGYKINVSNVKSAYSFKVGNGGYDVDVVLITRDNKVKVLNLSNYNGNTVESSLDDLSQLSNIVTAAPSESFGGHGFVLYDINGNQYPNGRVQ